MAIHGVIHGRTIELSESPGLPDGQRVVVQLQPAEEPPPKWLEHFTVDPAIAPAKIIIKGTRLHAQDVAKLIEEGRTDDELRQLHPELTPDDIDALHHYVQVPATLRELFGAWADDTEDLDEFLAERRRQRQVHRRGIGE